MGRLPRRLADPFPFRRAKPEDTPSAEALAGTWSLDVEGMRSEMLKRAADPDAAGARIDERLKSVRADLTLKADGAATLAATVPLAGPRTFDLKWSAQENRLSFTGVAPPPLSFPGIVGDSRMWLHVGEGMHYLLRKK